MSEIEYVRCRWLHNDSEQMVPATSAPVLAEAGELVIVDDTPGPYRPVEDLDTETDSDTTRVPARPKRPKATTRVATEPATPATGEAVKAEEATE